jgi:hypothetical protein
MNKPRGTQYDRSQAFGDMSHVHAAPLNNVQFSNTDAAQPDASKPCPSR